MELYIENNHPLMELLLQRAAKQELTAEGIVVLAIQNFMKRGEQNA